MGESARTKLAFLERDQIYLGRQALALLVGEPLECPLRDFQDRVNIFIRSLFGPALATVCDRASEPVKASVSVPTALPCAFVVNRKVTRGPIRSTQETDKSIDFLPVPLGRHDPKQLPPRYALAAPAGTPTSTPN